MNLMLFADASSIHTYRWVVGYGFEKSIKVVVVTMNPAPVYPGLSDLPNVVAVHRVCPNRIKERGKNYKYLLLIPRLIKVFIKTKPDIVNSHFLTSYGILATIINRFLKIFLNRDVPHVISLHGTDVMINSMNNHLIKNLSMFALKRCDLCVSVSSAMTGVLSNALSVKKNKIITQQYGIQESIRNLSNIEKKYDFCSNRSWIVNSNIDHILDAFCGLSGEYKMALVGGGPEERVVLSKVRKDKNIDVLGFLPFEGNYMVLRQSKFFMSATNSDGASLSLLEAMAAGAIPIVSDIEPNLCWVEDGKNGFVLPLNRKESWTGILEKALLVSDDYISQMRNINKEKIEMYANFEKNMLLICSVAKGLGEKQNH